ncbi:putative disease resistance protein [Cinnamomum micranthum f. kanehirae]|uniref:Putative disease resistance protein n=1 Tax=Cinnamomum micranthum f. kanehirae TaxID=337451 RepID=A0A3S3QWD8_9MAGN|nr:putative disease resistance protein [Cinnamomum micranthum f. kanehirae]
MSWEAIVSLVVGKLGDLLFEEAESLLEVREEIEWIKIERKYLLSFLKDADAKYMENTRGRNWVREITDIAYDAEDIIDNYLASQSVRLGFIGHVKKVFSSPDELPALHDVVQQIRKMRTRITDLSSNRHSLDIDVINEGGGGQEASSSSSRALRDYRWNVALFEKPDMVGMRDDMMTLKERLIDGNPKRCVVSIVGMGGSGKTTLAKKVCRDVVDGHFHCHAFIYVSQHYKRREIWTSLIKSVMRLETEEIEKLNDQELGEKLRCHLSGKRYLVVIDDIWCKDAWDTLKDILPDSSNGSRVILTTRNRDVAAHADPSSPPLEIRLLKDDEAWELFMKKTLTWKNAPIACPEELEETGRQILAKCHGLPLAIVLLGGLLSRRNPMLCEWSRVLENVTKRLANSPDKLMEILALSYYDLPYNLRPCFLYFGLFRPFPNDEISSKRLIRLWVAEGFINQEGTTVMNEDLAEEYLQELIDRSMIQVAARRSNGSVRTCRIHDLLRDLSIYEAKESNFFAIHADNDTNEGLSSVRRLALYCHTEENEAINCPTATLRSMLCFSNSAIDLSKLLNRGVKFLRVLEIGGEMMSRRKLPKNIGDLVNLRYLNLRGYAIKSLPSSIGKLSYLLTLELTFKGTLPNEICNLRQLRHLYAYYYDIGGHPLLHNLRNLQTLCLSAGSWIEDCLGKMINLRKLGIRGNLKPHHQALSISIDELSSLRSLKLVCGNSIPQDMSFTHRSHPHLYKIFLEGLMENLIELPRNLAKLTLSESKLEQDAIATLEKLPHLKILRLLAGSYCSENMICSSGRFLRLEFLEFDCSNLKEWIAEEGSMPSLNKVELHNEDNLRTLPEKVRDLSR